MSVIRQSPSPSAVRAHSILNSAGTFLPRYGLVVVIAWIGALKFTSYEAHGIEPLVSNSPLMGWLYGIFSITAFSNLLGVLELATAGLLAVKPWFPRASAVGSVLAIGLFLATISFMFTTPGIGEASAGGFPVLSATGQFLVKDLALLGVSVWTLLDALSTGPTQRR
ncbi:YkgB family protein [Mycolicibacterium porcinum]|uniref:DUF417 family protein n=1 Tax=Mycolicibacterium porcinum TaxID=39693 RepID=A0ABV3VD96_9MYCO